MRAQDAGCKPGVSGGHVNDLQAAPARPTDVSRDLAVHHMPALATGDRFPGTTRRQHSMFQEGFQSKKSKLSYFDYVRCANAAEKYVVHIITDLTIEVDLEMNSSSFFCGSEVLQEPTGGPEALMMARSPSCLQLRDRRQVDTPLGHSEVLLTTFSSPWPSVKPDPGRCDRSKLIDGTSPTSFLLSQSKCASPMRERSSCLIFLSSLLQHALPSGRFACVTVATVPSQMQ
jgi:hypothetical protein